MRINSEILSNSADVDIIYEFCKKKQIATKELAELIGQPEISNYDPTDTTVESIRAGREYAASIKFRFYTSENITDPTEKVLETVTNRFTSPVALITYLTAALIMFSVVGYFIWKEYKQCREEKQENDSQQRAEEVVNPFINVPLIRTGDIPIFIRD